MMILLALLVSSAFAGSTEIDALAHNIQRGMPDESVISVIGGLPPLTSDDIIELLRAGLSASAIQNSTDGLHPTNDELTEATRLGRLTVTASKDEALTLAIQSSNTHSVTESGWEEDSIETAEGTEIVVGKKNRGLFSIRIDSGDKDETISCIGVYGVTRTSLAMFMKTASLRSDSPNQIGSVVSFTDSMNRIYQDKNVSTAAMFGMPVCAIGIDAFPGSVIITLGGIYKNVGRTATITGAQANEVASWLVESP